MDPTVNTVSGPVPVDELGMTLVHEHLHVDWTRHRGRPEGDGAGLRDAPVDASIAWLLRDDPHACVDNGRLDDPLAIAQELNHFVEAGGRTVVECTPPGVGRDPGVLREISRMAGVTVVMGSGWYVHGAHDGWTAAASEEDLCEQLLAEFTDGVDGTGIKPGIIGEIGVSPQFTDAERRCLRAAARTQLQVGVPLLIHLPGWQRRAHEVLDIVLDQEGVAPGAVVLCHMDPSGEDRAYQRAVADRGVWLEFDMIGMPFFFPGEGQSPAPEQTAAAVAGLVRDGYGEQLLLSHDMALKSMWTRNGGNGLGYVPRLFLSRLRRHGVPAEVTDRLLTTNVRRLFAGARTSSRSPELP
jgi:phosphotriesterase-related protein